MINIIVNKVQNLKIYYFIPSFFLTLPIFVQFIFISDFNKWLNAFFLYLCWNFFSIGIIGLLRIKFKYLAIPIFISLIVATYTIVTGENIEYEVYASINNTNIFETVELMLSPIFMFPFVLVLLLFFIIYKYFLTDNFLENKKIFLSRKYSSIFLILGIFGVFWNFIYQRDNLYKTYPLNIPFYQKMYLTEWYFFEKNFKRVSYKLPENIKKEVQDTIYILVIGESARKHSMSVYGYNIDTTPIMKKNIEKYKQKAFFFDTTASGISTRLSVPMLLSTANTINYSNLSSTPTLVHAFNVLNYNTSLISNQEVAGRNNDIISLMFSNMGHRYYINDEAVSNEAVNWSYDINLIPHVKNIVNTQNGKDFIIVHLMGSHWNYSRRYPKNFSTYSNERVGAYDNSIKYTDYVIGKLIDLVKTSYRPAALIYTSDHGENLNDIGDGNYFHAVKKMTSYEVEVPLFISFNDAYVIANAHKVRNVSKNSNRKISHDNVAHTLLGLVGLYDSTIYKKEYDISSSEFKESTRFVINRRRKVVDVDKYLNKK